MNTIYKYGVPAYFGSFTLYIPQGAKILTAQNQEGYAQLWALVDLNAPYENRSFEIRGTGQSFSGELGPHIATFELGGLMFHLFHGATQ